ncbi:Peptidoglycan glycosyltransferase MrdB [Maioricimonas rarisocia]|uniref:Cell wall polymerase n=1 Tax=Maioricimonas rarisocia TaxID=2528026 RepID=A0A517Z8T6_9PLAN|nr:FtsW/RodA/SpoVE family cell cycle protein [Maioricimonas rarisocia]QDU38885.1 Peptidoglycan glycosyltransferase MrdB [Maioricimonas rarisocia]
MHSARYIQRIPWSVPLCAVVLVLVGIGAISRADALAGGGVRAERQAVWLLLAIPATIAAAAIPHRLLRGWSYPLFGLSLLLLVAVYFFPARNGAHRWIPLGLLDFQPSELAKLAYILALSHYLMFRRNYRRLPGLIVPFAITGLPVVLILREPDLGTSMLFFPVLFSMLFAAGARPRHLCAILLLGAVSLPALWMVMSAEQKSRITTLFMQEDGGGAPRGDGYHLYQSKQVLALGGRWGSAWEGATVEDPLAYHLPAAATDFVFCMVGERWGLAGALAVLTIYLVMFGCGLRIADQTDEPFARLVAVGIVALLAAQVVINTGMTVGLAPITGLTLPLMSYGGSSLLMTCIQLGLLVNIGLRPGYEIPGEPFRFGEGE